MSEKHLTLEQFAKSLRNSITNKSSITVKSDDSLNVKSINILSYLPPPPASFFSIDQKTGKLSQQYNECLGKYNQRLEYILNDLELILKLPSKSFVNQIQNDKTFNEFYTSFLKYSPRPYELELNQLMIPEEINLLIFSIKKHVFMILHRISTDNEEIKSPEGGVLTQLYSSYLFDLPNLFDLSVLYEENAGIQKLISDVVRKNANNYQAQFKKMLPNIVKVFKSNESRLQTIFELNSNLLKQNYSYRNESHNEILELLNYFIDITISFSLFTNSTPIISHDLLETNFHNSLIECIEHTIFEIDEILSRIGKKDNNENIPLVAIKIQILKYEIVKFVDKLLDQCIVLPITEKNYDSSHLELFYHSYLHLLDYKKFLTYYTQNFDVMGKLNRLFKVSKDKIDQCQFDFIMDNIKAVIQHDRQTPKFEYKSEKADDKINEIKIEEATNEDDYVAESLLEIFPEYSKTFIADCLHYFNFNKEQLINAILENNLPKELQNKLKPSSSIEEDDNPSGKNKTIYDGDQFDVSSKNKVDYSRIHIGKRNITDNLFVNEPVSTAKFDYQNQLSNNDNEYEDEYDDTYDDHADAYDETSAFDIKPLNEKLDLKKREYFENEDEEEEQGNQSIAGQSANINQPQPQRVRNTNFVEDPAKVRERQQARYEAKQAEYAARKWNKPPAKREDDSNNQADEEAKQQHDRKYKNTNKAQLVHHNRRNLAAKKQNRGLLD